MAKEIEISEGYETRIEGNKVILEQEESEDERIRIALISLVKEIKSQPLVRLEPWDKYIAYLEKQKEQKPAECNEEDAHDLSRFIEKLAKAYEFNLPNRGYDIFGFAKDILKHLKINHEKVEWSEDDIDALVKSYSDSLPIGGEFQSYHDALVHAYRQGIVNTLKSLRPQPHWKPSEEQMEALARATNRCVGVEDAKKLLKLLEQLESL